MARDQHISQSAFTFSDVLRGLLGPSLDETVLETCQLVKDRGYTSPESELHAKELQKKLRESRQKVKLLTGEKKRLEDLLKNIEDEKKSLAEETAKFCESRATTDEKIKELAQKALELNKQAAHLEKEQEGIEKENKLLMQEELYIAEEKKSILQQQTTFTEKYVSFQKGQAKLIEENLATAKHVSDQSAAVLKNPRIEQTGRHQKNLPFVKGKGTSGTRIVDPEKQLPCKNTTTNIKGQSKTCVCTFVKNIKKENIASFIESTDHEASSSSDKYSQKKFFEPDHQHENLQSTQPFMQYERTKQLPQQMITSSRVGNRYFENNLSLNRPKFKRKRKKTSRNNFKMQQEYKSLETYFSKLSTSSSENETRNKDTVSPLSKFLPKQPFLSHTSPDTADNDEFISLRRTHSVTNFHRGTGDNGGTVSEKPMVTNTLWTVTKINKFSDGSEVIEIRTPLAQPPKNVPTQIDRMMVVNSQNL